MMKRIVVLPLVLIAVLGCSLLDRVKDQVVTGSDPRKQINVPKGLTSSVSDFEIYSENSALVLLPVNAGLRFGADETPLTREELAARLGEFSSRRPAAAPKILYIAAAEENDYGSLEEVFRVAREKQFNRLKLVVKPAQTAAPEHVLEVQLPDKIDLDQFPAGLVNNRADGKSVAKPNPFTLVAEIKADGKLTLNLEEHSRATLTERLENIFRQREANGVFRVGTGEIEKTVFLKAAPAVKYSEVAAAIDALTKSGAAPILVLTGDLSD